MSVMFQTAAALGWNHNMNLPLETSSGTLRRFPESILASNAFIHTAIRSVDTRGPSETLFPKDG